MLRTVAGPTVAAKFTGTRNRMPLPHSLSCCHIIGVEKTGSAELAAADADEYLVFDDERGTRNAVSKQGVRHLRFPQRHSCTGIDGNQRCIERADKDAIS